MGRTSTRNFQTAFRAVAVDDSASGPDVSQDVQLVYLVEDLHRFRIQTAGATADEGAVVGEHAFLSLEINTPEGVEILQVSAHGSATPTDVLIVRFWTSQTLPTVTGVAGVVTPLRTGERSVTARLQTATIATAAIPATAFRQLTDVPFQEQYLVGPSASGTIQFFNIALGTANLAAIMGLRWRELQLFGV